MKKLFLEQIYYLNKNIHIRKAQNLKCRFFKSAFFIIFDINSKIPND
jgi:hypothetical protein